MLADSHAHLDMPEFDGDRDSVIGRASDAGVSVIVNPGFNKSSSRRALGLAQRYPSVYCAAGVHPHDAREFTEGDADWYRSILSEARVVAVGEVGLDYYRDLSPRPVQREVFRAFIRLARELGKPLIVHDRDAHDDVVAILKEEKAEEVGGVMHCFSGDWASATECLKMGFMISFAGPITYRGSARLSEVAKMVPRDMLLVETDCPYLAPQPFRGRRNEPAYLTHIAGHLARTRCLPVDTLEDLTFSNTCRLFGIRSPGAPLGAE
ncbi:MAG: TatD family hydrolase [Firmicutes bacterium]|jgi:TatD DNase family protein|nr:TatD family hydrolase [Bacillota bacterium]